MTTSSMKMISMTKKKSSHPSKTKASRVLALLLAATVGLYQDRRFGAAI